MKLNEFASKNKLFIKVTSNPYDTYYYSSLFVLEGGEEIPVYLILDRKEKIAPMLCGSGKSYDTSLQHLVNVMRGRHLTFHRGSCFCELKVPENLIV